MAPAKLVDGRLVDLWRNTEQEGVVGGAARRRARKPWRQVALVAVPCEARARGRPRVLGGAVVSMLSAKKRFTVLRYC